MSVTHTYNSAWFIYILLVLIGTWSLSRTKQRNYRIAAIVPIVIGLLGLISLIIHSS